MAGACLQSSIRFQVLPQAGKSRVFRQGFAASEAGGVVKVVNKGNVPGVGEREGVLEKRRPGGKGGDFGVGVTQNKKWQRWGA